MGEHSHRHCPPHSPMHHGSCGCRDGKPRIMGFIIPCALIELSEEPCHGYHLIEKMGKRPYLSELPDKAIIYRHLRKMEEEGIVTSTFEPGEGPARKVYSITDAGKSCLSGWMKGLRELHHQIERFFQESNHGKMEV